MTNKRNWRFAALAGLVFTTTVAGAWSANVESAAGGTEPGTEETAPRAAKTWIVEMKSEKGVNSFEPEHITIKVGDIVKWVDVSGRHNVQFWPDSVPQAALPLLKKATSSEELGTPRLEPGESVSIAFTDGPAGVYKYFCEPHLRRGQTGSITVQP